MEFRPCIDIHNGTVKQIVGSSLKDDEPEAVTTNFIAENPPEYYARLYQRDNLTGGHIIKLGPGNDDAALAALTAWPGGMQLGGGITADNAAAWLDWGASHVIVTSYVFREGRIDTDRLHRLVQAVGKERLVLDLSCRRRGGDYYIVTDRWQKFTVEKISPKTLEWLAGYCAEFLIHAADVEGKCSGIEVELVQKLGRWSPLATTYAGGVRHLEDLRLIHELTDGRLHVTAGSSLDIFGGTTLRYQEAVAYCRSSGR